jgi:O-antigen ligase
VVRNFNLEKTYQFLLIALAFLMPLTVFGGNLIILIIVSLWLISGNFKEKFHEIIQSKLLLASILFFTLHLVGLIWSNNLEWGLHIVRKMWYFLLLLPILYSIVVKEDIHKYLASFLLAICLTEILSYLVWFELIEPFKNARVDNPTPFMSHISYNVILAFAFYLVMHRLIIIRDMGKVQIFLYSFFAFSISFNMFITGGRAGQVAYFVILVILVFQFFSLSKLRAFLSSFILIPVVFISAYSVSPTFNDRVDAALLNVINYSEDLAVNNQTSVGYRMTFAMHSWEIIKKNPLFGVGTGDFPEEYKKINMIKTPLMNNARNPHNMYILVSTQLGLLGLISFLSIFYFQFKIAFNSKNIMTRDVGFAMPLMFLVIMFSDSYLLGHFTTLIFIFFSAFLYKDFESFK